MLVLGLIGSEYVSFSVLKADSMIERVNKQESRSLIASKAASWYIETVLRSTHPSRRNPLGLPSPMHTTASTGPTVEAPTSVPLPSETILILSRMRSSNCDLSIFHVSEANHFSR